MTPLLLLLPLLLARAAGVGASSDPHLPFTEQLDADGLVTLRWGFNQLNGTITFQLTVSTTGWVGFGLSPNGGMMGADMVTGGVGPNGTYFTDRHGIGNVYPPKDEEQSYTLLSLAEVEGRTTMTFRRSIKSCDKEDFHIAEGPIKLIYAYGTTDEIQYHSSRRGTKEVNLLGYMPRASVSDSKYLDLTVENVTIPPQHTYYHCKILQIPPLNGKHHAYRFEPVIEHLDLVHHILLYSCPSGEYEISEKPCYDDDDDYDYCFTVINAWGIGGGSFELPENVGISIGTEKIHYKLEIHYNNPTEEAGRRDNSGLRLYYTSKLREHDAAVLTTGLIVAPSEGYVIPPKATGFRTYAVCNTSHFPELQDGQVPDLHVMSVQLHTHLAGRKVRVGLFRGGEQVDFLGLDDDYNFAFQRTINMGDLKIIKPGDEILVECTYSTVNRTGLTKGGYSTTDEMCLAFLLYYPAIDINSCWSHPDLGDKEKLVAELATKTWTQEAIAEHELWMKNVPQHEFQGNIYNNYSYNEAKIRDMMRSPTAGCSPVTASPVAPGVDVPDPDDTPPHQSSASHRGVASQVVTSAACLLLLCVAGL